MNNFVPSGMTRKLESYANHYLSKGLSGAKIIVYPPIEATFTAQENVIIGNVAFDIWRRIPEDDGAEDVAMRLHDARRRQRSGRCGKNRRGRSTNKYHQSERAQRRLPHMHR